MEVEPRRGTRGQLKVVGEHLSETVMLAVHWLFPKRAWPVWLERREQGGEEWVGLERVLWVIVKTGFDLA